MESPWEEKLKRLVRRFFAGREGEVYFFGSRVWGNPQRASDFDLAVRAEAKVVRELREFLEESTFPFEVDVVSWEDLPRGLREKIAAQGERWI